MIHSLTNSCYTVNYKTSKSKVYKMYLLKLELLFRVLRYLLVKGRSVCNGVVSSLIALCFRRVEHFLHFSVRSSFIAICKRPCFVTMS
jgi:hypothetical protein